MKTAFMPVLLLFLCALVLSAGDRQQDQRTEVRLALFGDIMLGRGVAAVHSRETWPAALSAVSSQVQGADIAFANLESPLTSAPQVSAGYDLSAPDESVQALAAAGLDVLSLANNHSLDSGLQGLDDTRQALAANHLVSVGPGLEPVLLPVSGKTIAFLALDDSTRPVAAEDAAAAIRKAKEMADWVVVSIHWGREYSPGPEPGQRQLARQMVAAGADVIAGHHPHVLQPVEILPGSEAGKAAVVAYSLGNALFDQPTPPAARQGALTGGYPVS